MGDNQKNSSTFFNPRKGEKYDTGINGKKILVVGDSFYCTKTTCDYYSECTDTENRNSSKYDETCPERLKHKAARGKVTPLHDEPTVAIDEYESYAYLNFKGLLQLLMGEASEKINVWDYVAFTNYIQFFLPNSRTSSAFIDKKNYLAFKEVVKELKPNVVVTWGNAVADAIRNEYGIEDIKNELKDNQYYCNKMKIDGHSFNILNLYHPSSRIWPSDIYNSYKYFKIVLDINQDKN